MSLQRLVEQIDALPPLPDVCSRLEELLADPRSTARDVARVVEKDISLASQVIKLANSAFFAVPGGVDTVQRAVQMMGFSAIHQVVLCAMSTRLLQQTGHSAPPWMTAHHQAVAVLSHHLATVARLPERDSALTAGLLHDVGCLLAAVLAPDLLRRYVDAVRQGAAHGLELETEIYGADHQQLGRHLGEHWGYPPALVHAIEAHHGEVTPLHGRAFDLADVVHVADGWSWALARGFGAGEAMPVSDTRATRAGLRVMFSPAEKQQLQDLVHGAPAL